MLKWLKKLFNKEETKKDMFIKMYNKYPIINIYVVSDLCEIPTELKLEKVQMFQFGKGLANPIPDFVISDAGLTGTLSFRFSLKLKAFSCFFPWDSIIKIDRGESKPPNGGTPKSAPKNDLVFQPLEFKLAA